MFLHINIQTMSIIHHSTELSPTNETNLNKLESNINVTKSEFLGILLGIIGIF